MIRACPTRTPVTRRKRSSVHNSSDPRGPSYWIRQCGVTVEKVFPDPVEEFEAWSAEGRACGVRALETFAAGLEQDGSAVRAALTMPWSNGQTEGQVTKLKPIKRSMYGRAGFDLLRRRVLLAA